jgi:hypothetical protein
MAIKRVDPNAKFKVISEVDDALISETSEELAALRTGKIDSATGKEETIPSRYEQYAEDLDETKLKFKDGVKPTYFLIRCLKNNEVAEIQKKHFSVDSAAKKVELSNPALAFLDYFTMGCLGVEAESGKVEKIGPDDVGYGVAVGIGSLISLFTSLGKHLKK